MSLHLDVQIGMGKEGGGGGGGDVMAGNSISPADLTMQLHFFLAVATETKYAILFYVCAPVIPTSPSLLKVTSPNFHSMVKIQSSRSNE